MENILRNLRGVLDVKARLVDKNVGEAEVVYNSAEIKVDDLKHAVPLAGGEKHKFSVTSSVEGG